MPVNITCNECGSSMDVGSECYCERCKDKLNDKITDLERENTDLEGQVSRLESRLREYE